MNNNGIIGCFRITCVVILLLGLDGATITAQNTTDTLTQHIRSYVTRNFSEARTFNLYWETSPSHNYKLKQNDGVIEEGKMKEEHTVKFAATVPLLLKKNFSLYANGQANFYISETFRNTDSQASLIFPDNKENYEYYKGTISGNFRTRIFNKPLIFNVTVSGDGWAKGFEKIQGSLSALVVLKHSPTTNLSIGLHGMSLYNQIPLTPIITYSHQFNSNSSIDLILPSRAYFRYQFRNSHRLSIGTSLDSEQFYMKSDIEGLPKTCFYSKTNIKPEIVYEYIINKRFYLIARGGGSQTISGGIYKTNRKGINGNPFIEYTQPMTPFFNLGFSYNLFK